MDVPEIPDPDEQNDDVWEAFRDEDRESVGVDEFKRLPLAEMPPDVSVSILDNDFPEATVWREDGSLICLIEEHLYTKYWEHKFSAYAFAEAMERAVRRLAHEGHPIDGPEREDDDVHLFVRWKVHLPEDTPAAVVTDSIKAAFDLVWHRADLILQDSDSVLILGKDEGSALDRLKRIETRLQALGRSEER